jgi:hypothetical protein
MRYKACGQVCLLAAIFCACAWGQTKPAAYVYISSNYSGSNNQTVGFSANADGQLTAISGSPWANNITYLAVNGKYLFGSDNVPGDNQRNIYSYLIESNGALKYVGATDIQKGSSDASCNGGAGLLLDHTGSYLYQFVGNAYCNVENAFESFSVNNSTGLLNYLGMTNANAFFLGPPLTMAADNLFAYAAGGNGNYSGINGYKKQSNGNLTDLSYNATNNYPYPSGTPSDNDFIYFGPAQADTTNHLAIPLEYAGSSDYNKIATYAINTTTGVLTTNSTFSNMPETDVGQALWTAMAPSGKLLAVGGPNGLQIFNFNPSGQATALTGLITRSPITMMYWDNSNHLYAISNADSDIHVFTVTSTGATEISGSPWSVTHPVAMIVQPE